VPQITCRYCQNVITIEHRKPPPEVRPFGSPGVMPSRTLYVDPEAARRAGKGVGCALAIGILVPILIPIFLGVGPWAMRSCKGAIRPFPINCTGNEEIEVSGNWEGAGPIANVSGYNCKIHVKNSKLKGTTFVTATDSSSIEITLENVTVETTDTMFKTGSNPKFKLRGSTLTSAVTVFDVDSNLDILELESSTIESKGGTAIKMKHNLKVRANNGKIRGKKVGIDAASGIDLVLKKGSEITSSDGVGIKTGSGLKIEAEGGKLEGADGAIVGNSGLTIEGQGLTLAGTRESAIITDSGLKLTLTDGAITSQRAPAISCDGGDLDLVNTKVQGSDGLSVKNGIKLKASKKTRIVASTGYGVLATSNSHLTINDAVIEGQVKAFKGTVNSELKLGEGARLAGKKGGIDTENNLELEARGATIEGGTGPGLAASSNARIALHQGVLRGVPAIILSSKPSSIEIDGTRVEGEQKVPTRW
jgi:hypothetical protein